MAGQRLPLPSQSDLKKICKATFESGADNVRVEVGGLVIVATKANWQAITDSPLDKWRRENGQS